MKQTQHSRQPMRRFLMLATVLCLIASLSACSTISQQDPRTIEYTEGTSREITGLLIELEEIGRQEPDCRYENFSERYREIKVSLNILSLREQAKAQNTETMGMVADWVSGVNKLTNLHRAGCLGVGEIMLLQKQFNSLVGNILKVENAKPQPLF